MGVRVDVPGSPGAAGSGPQKRLKHRQGTQTSRCATDPTYSDRPPRRQLRTPSTEVAFDGSGLVRHRVNLQTVSGKKFQQILDHFKLENHKFLKIQ